QFEESPNEIRMAARDNDHRAANSIVDRDDVGTQAVSDVVVFHHDAFTLRHNRLELSKIENHVRTIESANRAADDLARAVLELLVDHLFLDLANALHHRLLGSLSGDAAEVSRGDLNLNRLTELNIGLQAARF